MSQRSDNLIRKIQSMQEDGTFQSLIDQDAKSGESMLMMTTFGELPLSSIIPSAIAHLGGGIPVYLIAMTDGDTRVESMRISASGDPDAERMNDDATVEQMFRDIEDDATYEYNGDTFEARYMGWTSMDESSDEDDDDEDEDDWDDEEDEDGEE